MARRSSDSLAGRRREASYRKAIELQPGLWSNLNYLGTFLLERNRLNEAEATLRQALELAPDNVLRPQQPRGSALLPGPAARRRSPVVTRDRHLVPGRRRSPTWRRWSSRRAATRSRPAPSRGRSRAATSDYRVWRNLAAALYWAPGEREKAARRTERPPSSPSRSDGSTRGTRASSLTSSDCYAMLGDAGKARAVAKEAEALAPTDRRVAVTSPGRPSTSGTATPRCAGSASRSAPATRVATWSRDPTFEALRRDPRWTRIAGPARARRVLA